jgi:acyl-coenzyme A synthetase/AMP-(fatty) acid ligase
MALVQRPRGDKRCPVVDTWWQTERWNYDIAHPILDTYKPTYATHYHYRNSTRLMDEP